MPQLHTICSDLRRLCCTGLCLLLLSPVHAKPDDPGDNALSLRPIALALESAEHRLRESKMFRKYPSASDDAYAWLQELLSLAFDASVSGPSPLFPQLRWTEQGGRIWGFPNPDEKVLSVAIDDRYVYRITGELGEASDVIISTYSGRHAERKAGEHLRRERVRTHREQIEIIVSRERREGRNWLQMKAGADALEIRQVFTRWHKQDPGRFVIERLDRDFERRPLPSEKQVKLRQQAALDWMDAELDYWLAISERFTWVPENYIAQARVSPLSLQDQWLLPGRYSLHEGEAIIVSFAMPPGSRYQGWALYDYWTRSLDAKNRHTSLNGAQLRRDNDGRYRIVLAAKDPMLPNWLDTSAYPEGYIMWRVTGPNEPEQPRVRVVAFDKLREHLPVETRVTLPEQRIRDIERRQAHYRLRHGH